MGAGSSGSDRFGQRWGRDWRRRKPGEDAAWVGEQRGNNPAPVGDEGCPGSGESRWQERRLADTDQRFKRPEEFQWPASVRLTGMETPRDLEYLHYIASAGQIDEVIARRKFGKTCAPGMWALIHMGHPIVEKPGKAGRQWVWLPSLE